MIPVTRRRGGSHQSEIHARMMTSTSNMMWCSPCNQGLAHPSEFADSRDRSLIRSTHMKHVCSDVVRPSPGPTHAPPPRSRNFSRRALQHRWHFTLQSSAATCLRQRPAQLRTRWQAPCLAHAANPGAASSYSEQPKLAQLLCWRVVRRVAWAAACCTACVSLASSMQAAAPFAAASLTFRSAAQTGARPLHATVQSLRQAGLHDLNTFKLVAGLLQGFEEPLGVRLLALAPASYIPWQGPTILRYGS